MSTCAHQGLQPNQHLYILEVADQNLHSTMCNWWSLLGIGELLECIPMWDSGIRLKPAQKTYGISEIGSSTHHCIHQTTDCTRIWYIGYLCLISRCLRTIIATKATVFHDRCINGLSLIHLEAF